MNFSKRGDGSGRMLPPIRVVNSGVFGGSAVVGKQPGRTAPFTSRLRHAIGTPLAPPYKNVAASPVVGEAASELRLDDARSVPGEPCFTKVVGTPCEPCL
eukprot:TRINITY_DN77511_c0_g1_i1.p2 TRINITY_DN77511_c0_g1~~TRINITY_DN77511_c0_g1_i1.p2  ORF type:complete len:100 (-),score=9.74 TRINITY_DN77511_c0_g1_i1:294-593(-)